MKRIISTFTVLLLTLICFSQKYSQNNLYGEEFQRTHAKYNLGLPTDTFSIPLEYRNRPHIAVHNNVLYKWNTSLLIWEEVGTGGSSGTVKTETFSNVAALQASSFYLTSGSLSAITQYYSTESSGGGDTYFWSPTSTSTHNGVDVIRPTAISALSPGRWLKQYRGIVDASAAGILDDGSDQTARLNAVLSNSSVHTLRFTSRVKVNSTVDFQNKVAIMENGGMFDGTGRIENIYVGADDRSQVFDTTLDVSNGILNSQASVMWFGAKAEFHYNLGGLPGTYRNNNTPFYEALHAFKNQDAYSYFPARPRLYIPSEALHYYYFGDTLKINTAIEMYGDGQASTILYFPTSIGIYVDYGSWQNHSRYVHLHDFQLTAGTVQTQQCTGYFDDSKHGLFIVSPYGVYERLIVWKFNGHGIKVYGNTPATNGNVNTFYNCSANNNGGCGYLFLGGDGNQSSVFGGEAIGNARWGYCDSSFLGCNVFGLHTATNGTNNIYNVSSVTGAGTIGYTAIRDNIGIEPGVTPGWEHYWKQFGPGYGCAAPFPCWNISTQYYGGGGFYHGSTTNRGTNIGGYAEFDQNIGVNDGNTFVAGGFAQYMEGATYNVVFGNPAVKHKLRIGRENGLGGVLLTDEESGYGSVLFESLTGYSNGWAFDRATGNISMVASGTGAGIYNFFQDQSASLIGRASWPKLYNFATEAGIFSKPYDGAYEFRNILTSYNKPPDSFGGNGDVCIKIGAVSDTISWLRVSGIWEPVLKGSTSGPPVGLQDAITNDPVLTANNVIDIGANTLKIQKDAENYLDINTDYTEIVRTDNTTATKSAFMGTYKTSTIAFSNLASSYGAESSFVQSHSDNTGSYIDINSSGKDYRVNLAHSASVFNKMMVWDSVNHKWATMALPSAGGGDAYLANTQTFTGDNTFSKGTVFKATSGTNYPVEIRADDASDANILRVKDHTGSADMWALNNGSLACLNGSATYGSTAVTTLYSNSNVIRLAPVSTKVEVSQNNTTVMNGLVVVPLVETYSSTLTFDAALSNIHRVTITGNPTIAAPTNPADGQEITIILTQDGTGSRTVTWNTIFKWSVDHPLPTLSTTAGYKDAFKFSYDAATATWDSFGYTLGIH